MPEINCIVIEDEPLATKVLADYITQVPFLRLQATFKDALLATAHLQEHAVDLIFLDIHLPKVKGMSFLKTLPSPPAIIITTAYHQYAVEGFALNVTDYLLKPFDLERFLTAVNKVRSAQRTEKGDPLRMQKDYLFLTVQKKKLRVPFAEIIYIESQREYIRVVTTKETYRVKMGTQEIEALLPETLFKRVHRSFIVAVEKIDAYTADEIEMAGNVIPVGRAYKESLERL